MSNHDFDQPFTVMMPSKYAQILSDLKTAYLSDPQPWLAGSSGGKVSTLLDASVFDTVLAVPNEHRTKPVTVLCTDTRIEIQAVADGGDNRPLYELYAGASNRECLDVNAHAQWN